LQGNINAETNSRSQRYLTEIYEEIKNALEDIVTNKKQFLRAIENLQNLEFIEDDMHHQTY
jgi:hypothetical protein